MQCLGSNRRETHSLIDHGGLNTQLGQWAKKIRPEADAVLNIPHFPELVGTGAPAPLTLHIHTTHHPDEKELRRQFKVDYGEPVTKDSWITSIVEKGYIVPSDAPKAAASWEDPPAGHLRLVFTTLKKTKLAGVLPSSQFSQTSFVSSSPPETPSISAIDPTNTGLAWAQRLQKVLDLGKSHSIVQLETRVIVTFAGDERWRQRAVEVIAGLPPGKIASMEPVELWTKNILTEVFRSNGADEKDVEAVVLYSRFGGGMGAEFVPA
ncbi:hypothetical protein P7C70_g6950, partial [Phenoliferia sp. Uapishka_3]